MSKSLSNIKFSTNVRYNEDNREYYVQMVEKRFPWWILLCLLPLLLLIECKHDIKVHVYEEDTKEVISDAEVKMSYTSHFLFKNWKFFNNIPVEKTETTDDEGIALFKDCPCSVYSYIFYCLSRATFRCSTDCHVAKEVKSNYHYSWNVDMPMEAKREDLSIRVRDKESGDLLPDALVTYRYQDNGQEQVDTTRTDAGGVAILKNMRFCSVIDEVTASSYGYADTLRQDIPCRNLIMPNDSTDLRLRRIKDQIIFFVKDLETKEPIPEAECLVSLTYKNEKVAKRVSTSIDGKGRGVYDDAFLLYTVGIKAHKQNYNDSILEGGPYLVDKFNEMDSLKRTIWLRPVPYKVDFINIDSITGKPIPNTKNKIIVKDKAGKERTYTVTSNSNGVFPVVAKGNESVVIISEHNPEYLKKTTVIDKFSEADTKVRMQPRCEEISFKTVVDADGYPLLPDCDLEIRGSLSGNLDPTNSGNGEFSVKAFLTENLSIRASKDTYQTNDRTVNNTPVMKLYNTTTPIPLKEVPLKYEYDKVTQGATQDCYDLKEPGQTITFTWSVCDACTMLIMKDENGNEIQRFGRNDPAGGGQGVSYSLASGTTMIKIPTQTVCIYQMNVNGHRTCYTITRL